MRAQRIPKSFALLLFAVGWFLCSHTSRQALGQQVNVGGPFNNVGHGFYEGIGVRWGVQGRGWFFNFGGQPPAPPFGGFDPNAGANLGGAFRAGNANGFFQLNAGQGANSTFVSQTPNVTIPNGGNGYFIDGRFRPFVTSIIPVVGDRSDPSPLREKLRRLKSGEENVSSGPAPSAVGEPVAGGGGSGRSSTAERGALSVAAIKAQAAAEQSAEENELAVILEKAKGAEAAGKLNIARIHYQMAARRATGDRLREIQARLEALDR